MLQRGFLKPRENEKEERTQKNSRIAIFAGVVFMVFGVLAMLHRLQQQDGGRLTLSLIFFALGFTLIAASFWLNFFAQKK